MRRARTVRRLPEAYGRGRGRTCSSLSNENGPPGVLVGVDLCAARPAKARVSSFATCRLSQAAFNPPPV